MARTFFVVLLVSLAIVASSQSSGLLATARGGFEFVGNGGKGASTISGTIRLGNKPSADLMYVAKNDAGVTRDGFEEAVILLSSVTKAFRINNQVTVVGEGTFQGEPRTIEITLFDATKKGERDSVKVRVLDRGVVEFEQAAKLQTGSITFARQ